MKIVQETFNSLINQIKFETLLFEDVYCLDIFQPLIDDVISKYFANQTIKYTYRDLIKLLPNDWKGLKYFNKNKILNIIFCDQYTNQIKLNLTDIEIIDINNRFKSDNGLFVCDFCNDKSNGLLLIKSDVNYFKLNVILAHELIHFIQWETGKIIHNFLNEIQFEISDNDVNEISKFLNVSKECVQKIINATIIPNELEAYSNSIFYELKQFCNEVNIPFNRLVISLICEMFKNKHCKSFDQYFNQVKGDLTKHKLEKLLQLNSFVFLLMVGYFNKGYNAFKNHIYSYFDNFNLNKK